MVQMLSRTLYTNGCNINGKSPHSHINTNAHTHWLIGLCNCVYDRTFRFSQIQKTQPKHIHSVVSMITSNILSTHMHTIQFLFLCAFVLVFIHKYDFSFHNMVFVCFLFVTHTTVHTVSFLLWLLYCYW